MARLVLSENFTDSDAAAWQPRWKTGSWGGTGTVDINTNRGRLLSSATAGSGAYASLDQLAPVKDWDVSGTVTLDQIGQISQGPQIVLGATVGSAFSGGDALDGVGFQINESSSGAASGQLAIVGETPNRNAVSLATLTLSITGQHKFGWRCRLVGGTAFFKVWDITAGSSEPASWTLVAEAHLYAKPGTIQVGSGNAGLAAARSVFWDDITAYDVGDAGGPYIYALSRENIVLARSLLLLPKKITTLAPHTVAVGLNSETDTVTAINRQKNKAIGLNNETDSALTITRQKRKTLGIVTEADTATTSTRQKRRTFNLPGETDTAFTNTARKQKATGLTSETDGAYTMTHARAGGHGQAAEADTVTSLSKTKIKTLGITSESDTVTAIVRAHRKTLGIAIETDDALTANKISQKAVGLPSETDTALGATRVKNRGLGAASETDTSTVVGRLKVHGSGQCAETDAALALTRVKRIILGLATEADDAQNITHAGPHQLDVGQETDTANQVRPAHALTLGIAAETDTAQDSGQAKGGTLGIASEADTAEPVAHPLNEQLGLTFETDTGMAIQPAKRMTLGVATETDNSLAISIGTFKPAKVIDVGLVTETDTAPSVTPYPVWLREPSPASESDQAQAIRPAKAKEIAPAYEYDSAGSVDARHAHIIPIGIATEGDTALPLAKIVILGVAIEHDTAGLVRRFKRIIAMRLKVGLELQCAVGALELTPVEMAVTPAIMTGTTLEV